MAREGVAIQLSELYAKVRWVYPLLFDEIIYKSEPPLKEVMQKYPKVVHVISHAGTLGWIPSVLGLLRVAIEAGAAKRRAFGVFHRGLYRFWVSRMLLRYLFESYEPPTFAKVIKAFQEHPVNDMALFPEGDNCIVGDVFEIPAVSPRRSLSSWPGPQTRRSSSPFTAAPKSGDRTLYSPLRFFPSSSAFSRLSLWPLLKNPVLNLPTRLTHIPKFSMRSLFVRAATLIRGAEPKAPRIRWFQLQSEGSFVSAF